MKEILFNDGWKFKKLPIERKDEVIKTTRTALENDDWQQVQLPHDWLIYDTHNLYESNVGWYVKQFITEDVSSKKIFICFDGVYFNSTVFVNGQEAGFWRNGYTAFSFDITDFLTAGENTIAVRVVHESPNTRWYSGAGIFRNVRLKTANLLYIPENGVYINACAGNSVSSGDVKLCTEIINQNNCDSKVTVKQKIVFEGNTVTEIESNEITIKAGTIYYLEQCTNVENPVLWDIDNTKMYKLTTSIYCNGELSSKLVSELADETTTAFGFKYFHFDVNEGFFLNGKYLKLHGVCMHHDLGAFGSAVDYRALERQLIIMRKMGVNSIRTSHNPPAKELMEICDRIGLLVVSELYDMWELPKRQYDFARFFEESAEITTKSWVRRDRNHVSLIMWSIGNEIHDTHTGTRGLEVALMLKKWVEENDFYGNGLVTIGSNYMEWENGQKVGDALKYAGYNYAEKLYDDHHRKNPERVIYGSETSSAVRSRGIYHFAGTLSHDDLQCSCYDNSVVNWGRSAESSWTMDRDRKFCGGQYIWTGFDYIGEPTPYSTKNSYFGIVDTAGFPKDIYYFYQSVWTSVETNPMVHLLPYWDWNPGQEITVIAYTNAPEAELFFNGNSLGIRKIDHIKDSKLRCEWTVKYKPGELIVKAYYKNQTVATDRIASFGEPAAIVMKENWKGGFVEISTVDSNGEFVANARNRINIDVTGAGCLAGLDSGDSTDYDSYQGMSKRLFSGKLLAIVQAAEKDGEVIIKASSPGLKPAELKLQAADLDPASAGTAGIKLTPHSDEIPIRKIILTNKGSDLLDKNNTFTEVTASLLPENASYSDITWKLVSDKGVDTNCAELQPEGKTVRVSAKGDGSFTLRAMCSNGGNNPQIVSELNFKVQGFGEAAINPYRFVSASNYTISEVPINIIDKGALGSFIGRTYFGFKAVDFGKAGTSKLRLFIGNWDTEAQIDIWSGIPDKEGSQKIDTVHFPVNHGWDRFLPCDFDIGEKLTGEKVICFVVHKNLIFGGFEFIPENRAYEQIHVIKNDNIYGDDYKVLPDCIEGIGNNVVIEFNSMDFSEKGAGKITVCGRTLNEVNTIQIRYADRIQLLEFKRSSEYAEQEFLLEPIYGNTDIQFVFLPGSSFDFKWFKFD
jgi:beta-galactosidase